MFYIKGGQTLELITQRGGEKYSVSVVPANSSISLQVAARDKIILDIFRRTVVHFSVSLQTSSASTRSGFTCPCDATFELANICAVSR